MGRSIVAALWAGIALVGSAAAQTSSPPPQQDQQGEVPKQVTSLTGCVHQLADQPTLFALQRIGDAAAQPTPPGGQPQGQTGQGQAAEGQAGRATGSTGSPAAADQNEGAWYRLLPEGTQDLKQFKGQVVSVSGALIPGRDAKRDDVLVHHIAGYRGTVTTFDLVSAPLVRIQSISPIAGAKCPGNQDDRR